MRKKGKKGAHSINTSVGFQNRAEIWRTMDRGRDTIEETTSVCLVGGGLKHGTLGHCQLHGMRSVLSASHVNP